MAGYAKPKVLGQHQQPVTGDKPRRVKVKAHHRTVKPRAPKPANPLSLPITPGSSITQGQAQQMAHNATVTRFGPQVQALNQGLAQSITQGQNTSAYYDQYLKSLEAYRQNAAQRAAATNAAMAQQADSIRALDQSTMNQTQGAAQADAANRGATASPQVAQNAVNASLVRQALEGGLGALLANQGAASSERAANLAQVVGPGQKLVALQNNRAQQRGIQNQIAGVSGQEGAYAQSFIDSLSGQEAKNILAASIASGKDLTQQASINERVRHDKASEHNTAAQRRATAKAKGQSVNAYGYTAKEWAAFSPDKRRKIMAQVKNEQRAPGKGNGKKPAAGPGSLTSGQENHIVQQVKGARAAAQSLMSQPGAKSSEVRQLLAAGKVDGIKYPHDVINAAFDLLPPKYGGLGGLSRANVKALHHMGVHVQGVFPLVFGGATSAPAKAVQQTNSGVFGF